MGALLQDVDREKDSDHPKSISISKWALNRGGLQMNPSFLTSLCMTLNACFESEKETLCPILNVSCMLSQVSAALFGC